jgi:hypothetical protein
LKGSCSSNGLFKGTVPTTLERLKPVFTVEQKQELADYFRTVIIINVKKEKLHKNYEKPLKMIVFMLDNHMPHCSLEAVTLCREHSVTMPSLPPHSSHKIQSLDGGFFFLGGKGGHTKLCILLKLPNDARTCWTWKSKVTYASLSETPMKRLPP